MAQTRAVVRGRIQELLGDVNPSERVFGTFRYNEIIGRNVPMLAVRCMMPRETVVSLALTATTYDYTIAASTDATGVSQVFLNSTGDELGFVPFEQFNAYYRQDTAEPRDSGTPREYTLSENTSNVTRIRIGPTPDASDTAKIHIERIPAALTADSSSIPFAEDLMRGLESLCAAEVVLVMSPEQRARLGLSPDSVSKWLGDADRVVHDYNVRQRRLGSNQNGVLRHGGRRHASWLGRGW